MVAQSSGAIGSSCGGGGACGGGPAGWIGEVVRSVGRGRGGTVVEGVGSVGVHFERQGTGGECTDGGRR